ncbi:unnamed protein product [Ranitomeya imitator]|uniref:RNase H type-1 domain-containing protein n=1 Tax=Ranitomeya imitator TaxID=111125 RepID=A0ABN9LYH4_9NEOB|nr:unnamed protein product [Ranitomeya imitator]
MTMVLEPWKITHPTATLLQYVDDLLLCADTRAVESFLANNGCKASKDKLQFCKEKVVFLGHCIYHQTKHLTEDRKTAVQNIPLPTKPPQLQSFLGLVSYCCPWILDASLHIQPLYDCLKDTLFSVTKEAIDGFYMLKAAITFSPALGLPDYSKLFCLFVMEKQGHATGVLTQLHGGRQRPLGYYSDRLDPVALGAPTCMRAVFATHLLLDKASDIILGHELKIMAPHDITAILAHKQPKHLSVARHLRLQCSLLLPDNVTISRCAVLNPATLLPLPRGEEDEAHISDKMMEEVVDSEMAQHDGLALMRQETSGFESVTDVPLEDSDLTLFVDGSRYTDEEGRFHTGIAVVTEDTVLLAQPLPPSVSAQEAELRALTEACKMSAQRKATIYSESRYAHCVRHDYGTSWRARDFITANGTPVRHHKAIQKLMESLLMPERVAVVKSRAHAGGTSKEVVGNRLADVTAKEAAILPLDTETSHLYSFVDSGVEEKKQSWEKMFSTLQKHASKEEKDQWTQD